MFRDILLKILVRPQPQGLVTIPPPSTLEGGGRGNRNKPLWLDLLESNLVEISFPKKFSVLYLQTGDSEHNISSEVKSHQRSHLESWLLPVSNDDYNAL